jgi:hypothetical protein
MTNTEHVLKIKTITITITNLNLNFCFLLSTMTRLFGYKSLPIQLVKLAGYNAVSFGHSNIGSARLVLLRDEAGMFLCI